MLQKAQKKTSDLLHFLSWMDPYIKIRRTQSSYSAGSSSAMGSSEGDDTDRSSTVSQSVLESDRDDQSQLQTQNTPGLRDFASVSVRELDETKLSSATGSGRKKYSKKTWQRVCQYQYKSGGGGGGLGASRFRDLDRILVLPKDYITARSPRRWVSKTYKYQNVRKGISYMHL